MAVFPSSVRQRTYPHPDDQIAGNSDPHVRSKQNKQHDVSLRKSVFYNKLIVNWSFLVYIEKRKIVFDEANLLNQNVIS